MLRQCAIAVAACALSACAVGARSGSPLEASPGVIPAANPWPSPGALLTYEGSYTVATVHKSNSLAIEQRIQTKTGTVGGKPVVVYDGVETESGKKTKTTTTFEAEVAQRPSAIRTGEDVTLLRMTSHQAQVISKQVDYATGNGVFDQVPEVPQARWSNTAARSAFVNDIAADSTLNDVYHVDGSYDESSVPVAGLTATSQSYADGNAVYQWPFQAGVVKFEHSVLATEEQEARRVACQRRTARNDVHQDVVVVSVDSDHLSFRQFSRIPAAPRFPSRAMRQDGSGAKPIKSSRRRRASISSSARARPRRGRSTSHRGTAWSACNCTTI